MEAARIGAAGRPRVLSLDWLGGLQTALIVGAVVQFFRCAGPAYVWVLLGTALPLARFCISPTFRRFLLCRIAAAWADGEAFAAGSGRLPWRAAALLVVLPAGLFFLTHGRPVMTGDSKPITLIASALVREGTTDLRSFAPVYAPVYHVPPDDDLPYFCLRSRAGVHNFYHSGMAVFAVPSAALARLLGADLLEGGVQDRMEKGVASWLAAACLGLFFLLALHLTDAGTAGLMTLLLATGSGMCSTVGQALWQHGGVLFWMLLALLVEFRTWRRPRAAATFLQGLCLAMAFASRLPSAVPIAAFGLWLLVRAPRRAVAVGAVAALLYSPWAWYYHALYGNPFGPTIGQLAFFSGRWRDTLVPVFLSPDHGLLVYQPWIVLGSAALLPGVRRRWGAEFAAVPGGWGWLGMAVIVPYLGLVASWYCWWGGQCWGSRLAVETVPFFALLCLRPLAGLRRLAWGRRLILAAALAGAFVHLPGVYLKADSRDTQPALFGTHPAPPGSWEHLPFLTPFVGPRH